MRRRGLLLVAAGLLTLLVSVAAQVQQEPPRFESSVELTSLDATVLDGRGQPVTDLQAADFSVKIDGAARRVVSAEWVPLTTRGKRVDPPAPPDGYSSNENATGGRLIVIAIDQPNIPFATGAVISRAAEPFLDRLEPTDRVAAVAFGQGAPATPFTADRARIRQALSRMTGTDNTLLRSSHFNIAMSEALGVSRGDNFQTAGLLARECEGLAEIELLMCQGDVQAEALRIASEVETNGEETIRGLRDLLEGLRTIDAPKTLVLVSQGFVIREQASVAELGSLAAAARTSLYVLRIDQSFVDVTEKRAPIAPFNDRFARNEGMELLASASRGSLIDVTVNPSAAFDRISAELSGYYLIAVESEPKDKDGKAHSVNVSVSRRGTTVKSRRQIMALRETVGRSRQQVAIAALSSPLLVSALPLKVATFSLLGPEVGRIQLLIHADVGTDYATPKAVSMAYYISDAKGRIVDTQAGDARLLPVMNGVPSALQLAAGASLPPGEYTLKLAVAEGDRVGTVEHPIHANLVTADPVKLSELMVGGPASLGELLQPTVGYQVTFGTVHGYVEAYGADASALSIKYEVAAAPDEASLLSADAPARPAGPERTIFSLVMPVRQLPPGKYFLRAVVTGAGRSLKTLTRAFEVAPPAVLMTSAEGTGTAPPPPGDIFLPVGDGVLARPFHAEEVGREQTIAAFRESVDASARPAFEKGAALLASGDYVNAEQSFKEAIKIDASSTGALAYLAATYAASGHDIEAANAWQTALIDGSNLRQIYQWLGDTLLRAHELPQARAVLEEAVSKWPDDVRFTLPLAVVYATFGQGREAVRALERHLASHPEDHAAQAMGVEWLYHLRASGAAAHSPAEDVKLARSWADAYAKSKGPQAGLVKQWLQFVENGARR